MEGSRICATSSFTWKSPMVPSNVAARKSWCLPDIDRRVSARAGEAVGTLETERAAARGNEMGVALPSLACQRVTSRMRT